MIIITSMRVDKMQYFGDYLTTIKQQTPTNLSKAYELTM